MSLYLNDTEYNDISFALAGSGGDSGNYLPLSGGTMTGSINMGQNKITSLPEPTSNSDAATKYYVDQHSGGSSGATQNVFYGTCSTAASTSTKSVTCTEFPSTLTQGLILFVKFSNDNTANFPTLRVNNGTAVSVVTASTSPNFNGAWKAGQVVGFVYATSWCAFTIVPADSTHYGVVKDTGGGTSESYDMEVYGTNPQSDWNFEQISYEITSGTYSALALAITEGGSPKIQLREQIWYGDSFAYVRKQIITPWLQSAGYYQGIWFISDAIENTPSFEYNYSVHKKFWIKSDGSVTVTEI